MSAGEFDIADEVDRLRGKAEYFEPADELRNLFIVSCLILFISAMGLVLILISSRGKENFGCLLPAILMNLVFYIISFLYLYLGNRFVSELEDENDCDPDVLYMVDIKKARTYVKLLFGLAFLLSTGAAVLGFTVKGGLIAGYLSAVQVPIIIILLVISSKQIKANDVFKVVVE